MRLPAAICENFNSIKVQLKRKCGLRDFFCFVFQFHKGTIKAVCALGDITKIDISIP